LSQELTGLIDLTPVKEDEEIVENFQPPQLCTQIKIMKALEDDADYKLKTLKENDLDNKDIEEMKLKLKVGAANTGAVTLTNLTLWTLQGSAEDKQCTTCIGQALRGRVCPRIRGRHEEDGAVYQGKQRTPGNVG
jgi:hypothetical protein